MGFWNRLMGKEPARERPGQPGVPHAVILHIKLADRLPSEDEQRRWWGLQDELVAAVSAAGAGELDGDEWGGGECVIFMYGPDAEAIWEAVAPVIEQREVPMGSYAIKRFQTLGGEREERVEIGWEG